MVKIYTRQCAHLGTADKMIDRIEALEAEKGRLQGALRGILMAHWERGTWKCVALRQKQYARAALEEKNDD